MKAPPPPHLARRLRNGAVLLLALWLWRLAPAAADSAQISVTVGSKSFTESVILGEAIAHLARSAGAHAEHKSELGGTRVLWNALLRGDIDVYPEYTGTIAQEILAGMGVEGEQAIAAAVAQRGVLMSRPLGFNNTYALGMKEELAARLDIDAITDLVDHPELAFGFSNEFMDRGDGWPSLRERYKLPQRDVKGLEHQLAYAGLEAGSIQVTDLYSTDADIQYHQLRVLEDDLRHFPAYDAVLLYRADLRQRAPGVVRALLKLEGLISDATMTGLNARAKPPDELDLVRVPETQVAADFLAEALELHSKAERVSSADRILARTVEHITLVVISLLAAILIAVPLGVVAARAPRLGQVILGSAGVIQTIPALALLVFMIPPFGLGGPPAIAALFLYSLLPIVRNTFTGLGDIPLHIRESAQALGLRPMVRLRLIDLPMASRSILAGIKTSAVINVGFATIGAFIGAGGYGQPILTGIRLDDMGLIMEGAVPAALMALAVQGLFDLSERLLVPRGLQLEPE